MWLQALSQRRAQLWHDAVAIAAQHPVTGTGAGGFARLAPTAADTDTTAAHSLLLGVAAETGWVGASLLAAVMVWALARSGLDGGTAVQAVVVAAWTAFQLQTAIDYIGSSWAVVMTAALVTGLASSGAAARVRRARRPRAAGPRSPAEEARR
jgi:O-antigen ligase